MDSIDNETEIDGKAWIAFQECSSALEKEQLAVELRPRFRDEETAFTGDYDYLMDVSRFGEIVKLFFRICVEHAVSFQVRQRALFKHQIVLMGEGGRTIMFEFWPHAELTTVDSSKGWSFLSYRRYVEACDAGFREEALALLFIGHLFFKKKDLTNAQNRWRLEEFAGRIEGVANRGGESAVFAGKIRDVLLGVLDGKLTLAEANRTAVRLLRECKIHVEGVGAAKRHRLLTKLRRMFRGWGGRIVPCVGPDGSGKTHFITAVMKLAAERSMDASSFRFKYLFRKNRIYAFINKRYRNRHGVEKNIADERLAHILCWAALLGYQWEVLKNMGKKAVFMDRFFLEFMLRGYREGKDVREIGVYKLLSRWVPEPRRMVVLTADDTLISSRKAELSNEAIRDFYDRYIAYAAEQKVANVLYLNTHHSGDKLAEYCLLFLGLSGGVDRQ